MAWKLGAQVRFPKLVPQSAFTVRLVGGQGAGRKEIYTQISLCSSEKYTIADQAGSENYTRQECKKIIFSYLRVSSSAVDTNKDYKACFSFLFNGQ